MRNQYVPPWIEFQPIPMGSRSFRLISAGMKLGIFFSFFLSVMEKREQAKGEKMKEILQIEDYRLTCLYSLEMLLRKLVN